MFLLTLVVFINIAIISVESFSVFSFNESSLFPTKPPSFASASVENSDLPDKFTICSSSQQNRYNLSNNQWPPGQVTLIWQPCKHSFLNSFTPGTTHRGCFTALPWAGCRQCVPSLQTGSSRPYQSPSTTMQKLTRILTLIHTQSTIIVLKLYN